MYRFKTCLFTRKSFVPLSKFGARTFSVTTPALACRVIRTAKRLGIKTVAVYSEADSNSMHVKMADEAYLLGPSQSSESYLNQDKICQIALETESQGVHPGYGFLSENSDFAEKLTSLGIKFIGPDPSAIRSMGSKSESKNIMIGANVPVVPGYHGHDQSTTGLRQEANKIGYPVLIKAIKGGGGKGMRVVEKDEDFEMMLESARKEAMKSFSDDQVLIEKYIQTPRHVEVQVFADQFGDAVYLFERDCSPNLSFETRKMLGETAVAAAKAVNYLGAGTVEFIMDNDTNIFYFMEMNTRLQVEHPVTEMVTGTDLVEWQIEVASGNPLLKSQKELLLNGHAFEARIYAENPENQFLPDIGKLVYMKVPEQNSNIRVETGVKQGDEITVYYDPMIAKLVVHGPDRDSALRILNSSLHDLQISGVHTNVGFLKKIINAPDFIKGDVETGFIKKNRSVLFNHSVKNLNEYIAQVAYALVLSKATNDSNKSDHSPWSTNDFFQIGSISNMQNVKLVVGGTSYSVDMDMASAGNYGQAGNAFDITIRSEDEQLHHISLLPLGFSVERSANSTGLLSGLRAFAVSDDQIEMEIDHSSFEYEQDGSMFGSGGKGNVVAPMSSRMSQVLVVPGQQVEIGTSLVVLEAMKMEHVIKSPKEGVVKEISFVPGELVSTGDLLVTFE
ncbi:Methylcrotonoyl-CoA carboxylase subunit alpha, mitochondrial, partial [Smittium mucronatum]